MSVEKEKDSKKRSPKVAKTKLTLSNLEVLAYLTRVGTRHDEAVSELLQHDFQSSAVKDCLENCLGKRKEICESRIE